MKNAISMLEAGRFALDDAGFVWRHACFRAGRWVSITPRRAENVGGKGYLRLTMQVDGKLHSVQAHRVIWTYRVGPIADGYQINHRDKNKTNNRIENLEVVTNQQNMDHAWSLGKNKPWCNGGSGFWRGKELLSEYIKNTMRTLRAEGFSLREISEKTGYSITHVQRTCAAKGGQE